MSNYYKKCNIIAGWAAFAVASLVYILTMEPTASLWDCAEFIATSYKLEVGHPPGAPLFMMIARFFCIFAPGAQNAALMVNLMSSLCGGLTVLFLFWSITHLGRKIYARGEAKEITKGQAWTVIGAGLVGALAYCFTDTQWFSAVEGEVYSMSSMFTALVFWAMLQWENVADKPHSNRWLILIAYLMGLSIGVHILNLLCIPALVFIYYFKKYKVTNWGIVKALAVAGILLVVINYMIIPYTVRIGAGIDRMFVNGMGLPANLGFAIYAVLLFALCAWAVWWTHRKGMVLWNTVVLCLGVILIGYSSYASVVIRASANPPMNSNDPDNPYALYLLLNRDQYGNRPLLYGPAYSSPLIQHEPVTSYFLNSEGKYVEGETNSIKEVYPDEFKFFFPRMYDNRKESAYKSWVDVKGRDMHFDGETINVPTAGENMKFFMSYQLNFMYWRYFLWNFVGRQNNLQGHGDITEGNWISGIKAVDKLYLGPQDKLPSEMAGNKARNTYYFLPFILGLIGLIYHLNRDRRDFLIVMMLFLLMGILLVIYFNTSPGEPRERDYVYAGSFYAFCIWIGLGVMCVRDWIARAAKKDSVAVAVAATAVCACVPVILVAQNWDDHDRSHRYVANDIGWNYLNAVLPNSIVINYGDNETFPLWYNQEVEGVRTDVRVMNTSYLMASWYIDQMRIKANESDPLPFSLPQSKYLAEKNAQVFVQDIFKRPLPVMDVMDFIASEDPRTQLQAYGKSFDFIPTKQVVIPVNKENAVASGIVRPEDAHLMADSLVLEIDKDYIMKNELMLLDLLANFDWKRPIYFTTLYPIVPFGLLDYLQFDGYAYRLVPIKTPINYYDPGRIDTEYLWDNLMEKFRFGNIKDERVYCDNFAIINFEATDSRKGFARLAERLLMEGDTLRAVQALDRCVEEIPFSQLPHSLNQSYPVIEAYYMAGEWEKGDEILRDFSRVTKKYIDYFFQFEGEKLYLVIDKLCTRISDLYQLMNLADYHRRYETADEIDVYMTENRCYRYLIEWYYINERYQAGNALFDSYTSMLMRDITDYITGADSGQVFMNDVLRNDIDELYMLYDAATYYRQTQQADILHGFLSALEKSLGGALPTPQEGAPQGAGMPSMPGVPQEPVMR